MTAVLALLLAIVHGVITELYMRRGVGMPFAVTNVFIAAFCVLAYIWYHQDARLKAYPRRPALSATVILLPVVGLPIYAALSRRQSGPVKSAFKAIGFVVLLLLVSVASGISLHFASAP